MNQKTELIYFIGIFLLAHNCFLAGQIWETEKYNRRDSGWNKFVFWFVLCCIFLGGILFTLTALFVRIFKYLSKLQQPYTQSHFWWNWYFNRDKLKMELVTLKYINALSEKRFNSNSYKDKLYRKTVAMINKFNNYEPNSKINEFG